MRDFTAQINNISSREDFTKFIGAMLEDFQSSPSSWENRTLGDYLDGIKSWTEDMDGYYSNVSLPTPKNVDWRVFATILIAATMYE